MSDEEPWSWPMSAPLDPFCSSDPRYLAVVDTNAILSSVDNDCRNGPHWRSRLLRMTGGGAAALYAPDHVYEEAYERLPRIASFSPVPLVVLQERFEEQYLPALRFVSVDMREVTDPQVLAITDADDAPTGQLAKLITPCIVFSEDRHLRRPGLAPDQWREVARFGVDLAEGITGQQVAGNVATLPLRGGVELIKFAGRKTGISVWLIGAILLGAAVLLLKGPERREAISKYGPPVVKAFADELERTRILELQGLEGLRRVLLPAPAVPTVKQQVAIVLARQAEPLLAREVQEQMFWHFPREAVPTVTEVRTILRDGPEFVQPERYRWQFGRVAERR